MTSESYYEQRPKTQPVAINEQGSANALIGRLRDLKYTYRADIARLLKN